MVRTHLYARNAETPVYNSPHKDRLPAFTIHAGNWMGVLEDRGDWIHVITVEGEGWVESENADVRSPGDLHIELTESYNIEYVNSSSGS